MRARTLLLLCTPAVIAAVSVAVPALAGSSGGQAHNGDVHARPSAASKKRAANARTRCFYTGKGKHRTRMCEIAGPAGGRGPRGFVGPHGKRGFTGPVGNTGATGPGGVARAYALVSVQGGVVQLVTALSHEFAAVTPIAHGKYCLTPAATIRPSETPAAVSGESWYGEPGVVPLAVLNAQHHDCAASEFEVETYNLGKTPPELSSQVAFSIVVP
jgi:hypothetical protein